MRQIDGIANLMAEMTSGNRQGWLFVQDRAAALDAHRLLQTSFFLADDDDEEIDMEDQFTAFMEVPIFKDVLVLEARKGRRSAMDIANGCIFYLQNDNFRD